MIRHRCSRKLLNKFANESFSRTSKLSFSSNSEYVFTLAKVLLKLKFNKGSSNSSNCYSFISIAKVDIKFSSKPCHWLWMNRRRIFKHPFLRSVMSRILKKSNRYWNIYWHSSQMTVLKFIIRGLIMKISFSCLTLILTLSYLLFN